MLILIRDSFPISVCSLECVIYTVGNLYLSLPRILMFAPKSKTHIFTHTHINYKWYLSKQSTCITDCFCRNYCPLFNIMRHITPILTSLHWLPVHFTIDNDILMITFKSRLGLVLDYITELLTTYEPDCSWGSFCRGLLITPRWRLKTRGGWAVGVYPLQFQNSLPENIQYLSISLVTNAVLFFFNVFVKHFVTCFGKVLYKWLL